VTAQPARHRLLLADDGIIDLIAVQIAARGIRTVAITRAERQLTAVRILACDGTTYLISKRPRTRPAPAAEQGSGGMTSPARPTRRRQRAMAARQALRLCEADLPQRTWAIQGRHRRVNAAATRVALRAAGMPPLIAVALRSRLRLTAEQEAER
jgi:hypothetical protein